MDKTKVLLASVLTLSTALNTMPVNVYAKTEDQPEENMVEETEMTSPETETEETTTPEEVENTTIENDVAGIDKSSQAQNDNAVDTDEQETLVIDNQLKTQQSESELEQKNDSILDDDISGNCGATENDNVTWELRKNNSDNSNPTYTLTISGSGNMVDYAHHSDSKHTIENGVCTTNNCDYNRPWSSYISNITSIVVEDDVTKIGNCAFRSMSSVSSVSIGHSVSVIGENAFKDCEALSEIEIPDSVIELKGYCFYSCDNLENVKIGTGLKTLDKYVTCFGGTSNLKSFEVVDGNTVYSNYGAILMNKNQTEIIKVPTAISGAVIIPEGITYVTGFSDCTKLTEITIPSSAIAISESCFKKCTSLEKVNFTPTTSLKYIGNDVNGSIDQGGSAFSGCTSLTEIVIPDSVEKLYLNTFADCTSLKTATLGTNINELRNNIFIGCTALETIYYNATSATEVGHNVNLGFTGVNSNDATNTVKLIVGSNVTSIPSTLYSNQYDIKTLISEIDISSATSLNSFALNNREGKETGSADITLICGSTFNGKTIAIPTGYSYTPSSENDVIGAVHTNDTEVTIGSGSGKAILKKKNGATITIIKKIPAVISFKDDFKLDKTYDGKSVSISGNDYTLTNGAGDVTFSYQVKNGDTWVDVNDAPTNAGTYRVKAVVAENDNYKGAETDWKEFSIKKADGSIKFKDGISLDKVYDGNVVSDPEYTTSGSDGTVTITWQKNTGSVDTPKWEDLKSAPSTVGTYRVVVELAGNDNYNPVTASLDFVISKADNTWTEELFIKGWTYNEKANVPTAKAKFGEVTFTYSSEENGTYTNEIPKNAGTYYVKATVEGTENYKELESDPFKFEIAKAVPSYEKVTGLVLGKGQALSKIELPEQFKWVDETMTADELGTHTFKAIYTPKDIANYQTIEVEIEVKVVPTPVAVNHVPTISASDKTITVGDKFDPLKDVTANDKEDGNISLTKENVIKNEVDISKIGTYKVTYQVTDSKGAAATKTITVTVNPKVENLNSTPTINAKDITLTVGDTFNPLKGVTASDKEDGDITKNIKVTLNEVDTSKSGVYLVTYEVKDSNGASYSKSITVTVKEKVNDLPDTGKDEDKKDPEKDNSTNTGVTTGIGLFTGLAASALGGIGILEILKRKKRK